MKLTRIAAILGVLTLGACGLYWTHDGTERQGTTAPDAGHGPGSCGGGYPDAGSYGDGGWDPLPDGGRAIDGGGYYPDAGWSHDGGGYLPDAWVNPAPDAH